MVLADLITKLAGESPVLSRSSHIFLRGAVYQVSTDLTYPQGSQTALALEEDDVHNIMQLRGFGPVAHVSQAHSPTDLDEKRNQWLDLMMSSVVGILVGSMPKQKSSAQFHVADGTGGMRQVADLRFEPGEWPIELVVSANDAESWMAHLWAEAEERGWHPSSISQLEATESSGTLFVHTANGPSPATLDIVWERPRDKDLRLRARPSGDPALSLDVAYDFINSVSERVRARKTLRAHQRAFLTYDGLPWRGELWLDDDHRLGPPSRHPDALLGPQIVIVDAMIEGIGQLGVFANFQKRLRELQVFLGFVLGIRLEVISGFEEGWVPEIEAEGRITDCKLRPIGYVELSPQEGFPNPSCTRPIERRQVTRPGLGPYGLTADMNEQWVPADIEQLWDTFVRLPNSRREHLLRAGNAYLIARSMWPDQRTAYAAFLVVACEALKPTGKQYNSLEIYDRYCEPAESKRA